MVSSENRAGLYIAIPIYFVILGGCVYWASRRMTNLQNSGLNSKISAHYLGGRDFDWLVTAGTLFASLFSGYTVVGVPNDAFQNGFFISWWIPSLMSVVAGCFGTGLRLRKLSVVRDHQSPVDFITDRFQSQILRYTVVFLQVVPALIYLTAQVLAVKSTFNAILGLDPENPYGVVTIMIIVLIFEWIGGLSSVALTDSIQSVVMCISFLVIPAVIKKNFGGWAELDLSAYPRPDFYQTFSKEQQWSFWQLSLINFSFFTLPHFIQRNYAARNLKALKAGYCFMTVGPWFTTLVGVFIGTVGVKVLGSGANPSNPFSAIIEEIMNLGGFAKGAGVVAITASLAAIMSTADSLIIAISHLVTLELVLPFLPNASASRLTWYARIVSMGSVLISLTIGLAWKEGITDLGKIQFPLSTQAVPAFLFGLFIADRKSDIHPWSIVAGALTSTVYVVGFYFGYLRIVEQALPVNAGISGLILNVAVIYSTEVLRRPLDRTDMTVENKLDGPSILFPDRPSWDVPDLKRFGKRALTPKRIWKQMEGIPEPLANPWWAFLFFFSITMVTPLTPENEPPMEIGVFSYLPAVVNGLPWWAFKLFLMSFIPSAILLVSIYQMPSEFPNDRKKQIDSNNNVRDEFQNPTDSNMHCDEVEFQNLANSQPPLENGVEISPEELF